MEAFLKKYKAEHMVDPLKFLEEVATSDIRMRTIHLSSPQMKNKYLSHVKPRNKRRRKQRRQPSTSRFGTRKLPHLECHSNE